SKLHPSPSSVTIQAAERPAHCLPYSDYSLCCPVLMVKLSGVWKISCIQGRVIASIEK
ncbi:BgTH12-05129, partial [Blumeria graminis f. sp. triticale]